MARTAAEIGALGLPLYSGFLSLDTNKNLRGAAAAKIYREMILDEPSAAAYIYAAYQLLRTDVQVSPGGNTDRDKKAAEFLETCLDDMRISIGTALRQAYSHIWAGWSIQELVYKRRNGGRGSRYEDGKVGWATWALRRQETLYRWPSDPNGVPYAFEQRPPPTFSLRQIPLNKCIHLVADDSEGSPEGRSALRASYRQWVFVKNLELLMGIALERGAGLPVFKIDTSVQVALTEDDVALLQSVGENLRQNEQAYVLLPPGIDFSFAPLPGVQASTYLETINSMRAWMLATGLADFIALGLGKAGGSFALGKNKSELFLMALNGYQERVMDTLNRHAVVKLFRYNDFGKLTDLPRLTLPSVKKYDLNELGGFVKTLDTIGALHITPADEAWFRSIADMIEIDAAQLQAMHEADETTQQEADEQPTEQQAGEEMIGAETGQGEGAEGEAEQGGRATGEDPVTDSDNPDTDETEVTDAGE